MRRQIARVEAFIESRSYPESDEPPILLFNASTRIHRVSLNAAYNLLAGWALRAGGIPIRYVVCEHGMEQCILGARPHRFEATPPCSTCVNLSQVLYPEPLIIPIHPNRDTVTAMYDELTGKSVADMSGWGHDGIPFGRLALPGLRWVMRRHHLEDDDPTRCFFRQFLASAVSLHQNFQLIFDQLQPRAAVVFNGIFYPEAIMRHVARERGIRAVTHEVGLRPFSAFFSHQDATFRKVSLDGRVIMDPEEEQALDDYLGKRFRGDFSMAGIRFWEAMREPEKGLRQKLDEYASYVPVFTNVIFDTSQVHANTLFTDMFEWLEGLKNVFSEHEDVLFILRAHPDEDRPGKASQESVASWYAGSGLAQKNNVTFIPPGEEVNSYKLIDGAKFVLVYNSSIGLEASILGKPVMCAGRARYTQSETVIFPGTKENYWAELEALLRSPGIEVPAHFKRNARHFLYNELFQASLDLSEFLQEDPTLPGMVTFKEFDPGDLLKSQALQAICRGITEGAPFRLEV